MASLHRLVILSPSSSSSSTTCFSFEPQQIPLKPLSSFFQKTPLKSHNLSLSLSVPFVFPLPLKTRRDCHFETHFSSVLESPPEVGSVEEVSKDRVYVQNIPWDLTPEDIRELFQKYGTVVDVELSMYNKTKNRGLAFVTMGSPEEALAALNNLQSYELNGRIIKLDYARPRTKNIIPPPEPKPDVTYNLFIANLSYEARAKDLREFFKSEGHNIVSAEVIFHENPRRSLGYGFVSFKSKEEAETALSSAQGKLCMGRPIRLARSKQFVKQSTPESAKSEEISTESTPSENQPEVAEGN